MEKLAILKDILDVDWEDSEFDLSNDLVRLFRAVVEDTTASWDEDDEFAIMMSDNFDDDHPIWDHVTLQD